MKIPENKLIIFVIIFLLTTASAFSNDAKLSELQEKVAVLSESMSVSLPFNYTLGLNWSDSHIGKLPRFGIGASAGITFLDIGDMNKILSMFGDYHIPIPGLGLPLPGYTFEGRLGGIGIPFDVGFKIGLLPEHIPILDTYGVSLEYLLIGGDIRFSVLPNNKIVKASIGFGVNQLTGGIATTMKGIGKEFNFGVLDEYIYTMTFADPSVGLRWNTTCFELKAQVSANFVIITPYAGFGLSYAKTNTGYSIKSSVTMTDPNGNPVPPGEYRPVLEREGVEDITYVSDKGIESLLDYTSWNTRFYTGMALNLSVLRFDVTGMYNIFTQNLGLSVGIRFQIPDKKEKDS